MKTTKTGSAMIIGIAIVVVIAIIIIAVIVGKKYKDKKKDK